VQQGAVHLGTLPASVDIRAILRPYNDLANADYEASFDVI
jgi:hypothetical protein